MPRLAAQEVLLHAPKAAAAIQSVPGHRRGVAILLAMLAAAGAGLAFVDPIPQSAFYHRFADTRVLFGIPNIGDVVSNLAFAIPGGYGLWFVLGRRPALFDNPSHRWPYVVFFAGVALISLGSAYYHWAPDNLRLLWDRLPITIAFMGLFAAFIADRIDQRAGVRWLLPVLVACGAASAFYWYWGETQGRGDLRFYGLVQFFPFLAMPVMCWLFPHARYTTGRHLAWLIGWYAVAKVFEHFDAAVFAAMGGAISGHSLKHLTAAGTVFAVVRMLAVTGRAQKGR
jgi:hypothetical protein